MHDIEAARHDDAGAGHRPAVRQLAENEVAEADHPDHLQIGIGCECRGGGLLVGLDQQPVAEASKEAEQKQD